MSVKLHNRMRSELSVKQSLASLLSPSNQQLENPDAKKEIKLETNIALEENSCEEDTSQIGTRRLELASKGSMEKLPLAGKLSPRSPRKSERGDVRG